MQKRVLKVILVAFIMVIVGNISIRISKVQAAESRDSKAKKAYAKFLTKKDIPWGSGWYGDDYLSKVKTKDCEFDIADINSDGIAELYIYAPRCEAEMARIFTCKFDKKGNATVIPFKIGGESFSFGNIRKDEYHSQVGYYKGKNIVRVDSYHSSTCTDYYATKGKRYWVAGVLDRWQPGMYGNHKDMISYTINGKDTTKAKYDAFVKKIIGKTKFTKFSLKANNTTNRNKYLLGKSVTKKPTLNRTSLRCFVGETYTLKVSGNNIKSKKWTSSNTKVVKVSSSGKVTAVGSGKATVTCKVKVNKSSFTIKSSVTILRKPSRVSGMKIKWKEYTKKQYSSSYHEYLYTQYIVITGYSKSGKKLWTYTTGKHEAGEGYTQFSKVYTCNNMVYFREDTMLKAIDMKTGKLVWSSSCKGCHNYEMYFDQDGNCYLTIEDSIQLYSFDKYGSLRYKVKQYDPNLLYPNKIVVKGNYVYVYFLYCNPDKRPKVKYTKTSKGEYYIRIKRSTGKIA